MLQFIARENIKRFEAQLETSADEALKSTIRSLLEMERQYLREIEKAQAERPIRESTYCPTGRTGA